MRINSHDRDVFIELIKSSEDRLIELILDYAEQHEYTRYTSTLKEAWRLSIEGLSNALITIAERSDEIPEMGPHMDLSSDPATQFGVQEARKHRGRGVNLTMFLGLMKYYRQSYLDLLRGFDGFDALESIDLLVRRFFDLTELAFCNEWAGTKPEAHIMELSRSSRDLANEKNKYLTLFESLSSPAILCDEQGRVDNYNDAAGRLLLGNFTPGSRYYAEQRRDLDPPGLTDEIASLIETGKESLELAKAYETPEGKKTFKILIQRMLDVSHKFTGYTILFNDITEALQWGKRLEEINHRQQLLIEDLHRTRERLVQSEKMASIGQLASGVAHEINTPMQYVGENIHFFKEASDDLMALARSYLALLSAIEDDSVNDELLTSARAEIEEAELDYLLDELPVALKQSQDGVKKVSEIVTAMKDFAKPGTDEKVYTDINAAIMSVLSVSANQWKYHAEIETDLDSELPNVPVVPAEMNQALLNIIVNAAAAVSEFVERDASTGKGKISIKTHQESEWVVIEISDTGVGIPQDIQQKIFDPFFTTREVGQGTGQGLTVAYLAIVKQHAGRISVKSRQGGGTTFEILLPITPDENESAERELWRLSRSGITSLS